MSERSLCLDPMWHMRLKITTLSVRETFVALYGWIGRYVKDLRLD